VLAVTSRFLRDVRTSYERERQPETLQEASGYLEHLTEGRYTRVWTPLDRDVLLVDDAAGRSLPIEMLSRGGREQLFLALRLALANSFAQRGARLPLVLDDVLVNFDGRRAKAAVGVLRGFAEAGHQVLVFTCHEHIVKLFRSARLQVNELPDSGSHRIAAPASQKPAKKRRKATAAPKPAPIANPTPTEAPKPAPTAAPTTVPRPKPAPAPEPLEPPQPRIAASHVAEQIDESAREPAEDRPVVIPAEPSTGEAIEPVDRPDPLRHALAAWEAEATDEPERPAAEPVEPVEEEAEEGEYVTFPGYYGHYGSYDDHGVEIANHFAARDEVEEDDRKEAGAKEDDYEDEEDELHDGEENEDLEDESEQPYDEKEELHDEQEDDDEDEDDESYDEDDDYEEDYEEDEEEDYEDEDDESYDEDELDDFDEEDEDDDYDRDEAEAA